MAKTSVADTARPWLALLAKYHFWLLALVVPLVLLPLLFVAQDRLTTQIEAVRNEIEGHISALKNVRQIPQHPNDSWANDIDTSTMRVKRETLAEWRKFWDSQEAIRVWPDSLGPDFVKAAETLKPDGKLSPRLLERYQDVVRTLVRELPTRLGVEDAMKDVSDAGQSSPNVPMQPTIRPEMMRPGMGPADGVQEVSPYVATWSSENQQRIFASFNWDKKPSTAKVLLAQEELWVYDALCDVVARINKPATGPHNAAISTIDELYVGYPAAEDNPGGVGGGRVIRVVAKQMPDGLPPDMMGPGAMGPGGPDAAVGRPPNPRFEGGQTGVPGMGVPGMGAPGGEGGAAVPADTDEMLRNWVYVDFTGKPLDATQLGAAVDCQMVHLMPFVLRVVIDQRQIDALLVSLATAKVPIDVRQVRINTSTSGQAAPTAGWDDNTAVTAVTAGAGRLYDVTLELRGTIGLATPPNQGTVGLEPGQGDPVAPPEAAEKPAPAPKAALFHRPTRRRIAS
jgi:hypothetical protein